ncbi:MAG: hypothetical protein J2P24_00275 [Streptosporangiales bacterium]|nr:hypothetical protein [Streptosporangiales bacterium]
MATADQQTTHPLGKAAPVTIERAIVIAILVIVLLVVLVFLFTHLG